VYDWDTLDKAELNEQVFAHIASGGEGELQLLNQLKRDPVVD
jgi:hypothetical protein